MSSGAILIPTYRRPDGLAKALAHIARLSTSASLRLIVADNDEERQEGVALCQRIIDVGYRFPIQAFVVPERGVVHVRNALLAAALRLNDVQFVAFLDDDEWPEPQWIQALLTTQDETDADAVGGTMLPMFVVKPPAWADAIDLYRQEQPDGPTPMIWGTCNVLLTRDCVLRSQPWFDPTFGLTGGEDVEFFTRLKSAGNRFAWATGARVFEDVPEHRVTLKWLRQRSFRIGNTNAFTQLRWRYRHLGRLIILIRSIARLAAAGAMMLRNLRRKRQMVEAMCLAARSLGELTALVGFRYREYG